MQTTDAMPYEPSLPCAHCGRGVDPVRAPSVLVLEHGARFFCSRTCRDGYRRAEPSHRLLAARPAAFGVSQAARAEDSVRVLRSPAAHRTTTPAPEALSTLFLLPFPVVAGLAYVDASWARILSLVLSLAGTTIVALVARSYRRETGLLVWCAIPLGAVALALSSVLGAPPLTGAGAACAACVIWLREWLTRRAETSVGALLSELSSAVPLRTRLSRESLDRDDLDYETRDGFTDDVRAGEEVFVAAGEIVPVDGVIRDGQAQVLAHPRATLTRPRGPNDTVLAGARVVEGSLRIAATRVGDARALFRPQSFGQDGVPSAARISRVVGRLTNPAFCAAYSLGALGLSITFGNDMAESLSGFGAALLALPALAIVRAVRVPFVAASATAAARGVVFRDAASLERAGRVVTAVLCSEGTATLGTPVLVEVSPLGQAQEARELVALALAAELAAPEHPLSRAVHAYAADRGVEPASLRRAAYVRGRGLSALADGGGPLALGNRQLLLSTGVSVAVADREAQRAETQGRTVVFLAVGGRARGLFVFEDPTRPEARSAVQTLFDLDVDVVLLSGDHRTTVEALARSLDITHIKAELSGDERSAEVRRLREAGGVVAVIGRAPADESTLSGADVSLTLDAAGGPHEGDVAVASDDLRDACEGLRIAHRARRTVQSVLAVTVAVGVLLAVAGVLSVLPPLAVLLGAMALDAWALPSTARLLPQRRRAFGATRTHGHGLVRKE